MPLVTRLALGTLSAAALAVLLAGTALGLDRRLEVWILPPEDLSEIEPELSEDANEEAELERLESAPPESALLAASGASPTLAPSAAAAPSHEVTPEVSPQVVVPDLSRVRVVRARRLARAAGIRLIVRDPEGYAIGRYDGASYRIRGSSMRPEAGTLVAPGTTVRVTADPFVARALYGY